MSNRPTRTEAIERFLGTSKIRDLAELYSFSMEVQVNVAQDGGERIMGEYKGRKWRAFTDGIQTWKPFRIPYNAMSDPEYEDVEMAFDLASHVEGIGLTGWDWQNQVSRWVGFDFDDIVNHKSGLTSDELALIRNQVTAVPWVTLRKSTSGQGLHMYVFLDEVPTRTHSEHAALARSVLGLLSATVGVDFESKVDVCGAVLWIWHRKMIGTDGLTLLKQGTILNQVPPNWRSHIDVVTHKRKKAALTRGNVPVRYSESLENLIGQRANVILDESHKKLLDYLQAHNAVWWWDQDNHMMVTHTAHLQTAFDDLQMRGFFKTNTSHSSEINCFCFPLRDGAWSVRRYSRGVSEHESWTQDGAGWTTCYLNKLPDLATAATAYGALEDPKGGYVFREADIARDAARLLGVDFPLDEKLITRETVFKQHKDGRLVIEVKREATDTATHMPGWLPQKDKWVRVCKTNVASFVEPDTTDFDDVIRHLVTNSNEDAGWVIKTGSDWQFEPLAHMRVALGARGMNSKDVNEILGNSIFKCWKLVNRPFLPEYPGDREWNRDAAQLRFTPNLSEDLQHSHWDMILNHCGKGLDQAVHSNVWCQKNGIECGADYLRCWIASLFQHPEEPLPYLFFYSQEQSTGKSIFHEALALLLNRGYTFANSALEGQFNAELNGAVLCVLEEINLGGNKAAYNKIKDWVTSRDLQIRALYMNPFHIRNTTHWVHCANDHKYCPVFQGDTRITMIYVAPIDPIDQVPKRKLIQFLEKEAADFLGCVMQLEIPESDDRLNIPALDTQDKMTVGKLNQTAFDSFLEENCSLTPGFAIKFSDLYDVFIGGLDLNEAAYWSKIRVGKELPPKYPKARKHGTSDVYVGNIQWLKPDPTLGRKSEQFSEDELVVRGIHLEGLYG